MERKRISAADILIGKPLPWDVVDANNRLLLKKGYVVEKSQQVEALVERGMFIGGSSTATEKPNTLVTKPKELPSALHLLNMTYKRLEQLLLHFESEADLEYKFLEVAKTLDSACNINADVAHASILLNRDSGSYPVRHCVDTAVVSILIARALNKSSDEIAAITAAALSMNVAMIQLQEELQNQKTSLSPQQQTIIHQHPQKAAEMLETAGVKDRDWIAFVLLHHENEDGSGYPKGVHGNAIPQSAKIISLADRYSARVSSRNYRKALLPNSALRDMLITDKEHISPALIKCFIDTLGIYPAGTFVKLENGEMAVVTGKGETSTTPVVHSYIGQSGDVLLEPIKRDTSKYAHAIREVVPFDQANFRLSMQRLWGEHASF